MPFFDLALPSRLLYRVGEAAELLAISRAYLNKCIADGRVRSIKIGRARRIPRSALEEFVARLLAEQAPPDDDSE